MERRTNTSPDVARVFAQALDKGGRVLGATAVATGAVAGYEIVRHFDSLGIDPISIVDAQECAVLLKRARVEARMPDGSVRPLAGRRFTLAGSGRTYNVVSDGGGNLSAAIPSKPNERISSFEFKGSGDGNGNLSVTATDVDQKDPNKKVKPLTFKCNEKVDTDIVFEGMPSNATPGTGTIELPNTANVVSKPANSAPPASKPAGSAANSTSAKDAVNRILPKPESSEQAPQRGLISWSGLDPLRRYVDEHKLPLFVVGAVLLVVGEWGTGRGRAWYRSRFP